ncbi:energy transducer TonB [Nannocystis pusilla]|uniref:energy transducer TonB n=1 Tax=Nannocystis pusilla TaxID=889268 RepID=UPI003DA51228
MRPRPRRLACHRIETAGLRGLGAVLTLAAALHAGSARAQDPADLVQPVLQNSVELEYPEDLRRLPAPPSGQVVVKLVVGVDGVPKELEVVQSVHPELDALAKSAVAQLRYAPGLYKGRPIEVVLKVGIDIAAPPPLPPEPAEPPPEVDAGEPATDAGEPAQQSQGTGPIRLRGVLLEAGQRVPVSGASVLVVPAPPDWPVGQVTKKIYGDEPEPAWTMRAETAPDGSFELRGVPDGKIRIIALAQGFDRYEVVEELAKGDLLEVKYYARRLVSNPFRTVVKQRRDAREEVARRTITPEEIYNLPGTQGDALKSLQNFPGVARAPFGLGLLIIRGAAPGDSKTYLGYHEIPQLFHFGALSSTFNSDILAQIDFIPGNFDSRFGDAIGGIINVNPRKGRRDGYHGYVDADVFDAGIMLEGPIKKGSFVTSFRRSYVDAILKAALPKDIGLGLSQAPRYYDYQFLFDYPVGGGELSVRWFGSDDRLRVIAQGPNETMTGSENQARTAILFHRLDLVYRKQDGPWDFLITPSINYQSLSGAFGGLFTFNFPKYEFSWRAEASRQLSSRSAIRIGTELQAGRYEIGARAPSVPAAAGTGDTGVYNVADVGQNYATPAIYTTATIGLGERFTLYPGARMTYYALQVKKATVDPRVRFNWQVGENTAIKGGVGLYSQIPDLISLAPVWGNPRSGIERAVHTSLGVAQVFDSVGVEAEVTGFYKYVFDRSTSSSVLMRDPVSGDIRLENFANQGTGQIFGMELLVRKALTKRLFGWVSYTLMKSLIQARPGADYRPFSFDQPHILTILAVYKLPRGWQIGGRFRLVSGNPSVAYFDSAFVQDGYEPWFGRDERLPAFHQLDLRVDKRFTFKRVTANFYLDIINVYNRQNGEAWVYSYNLQQRQLQTGLPILPSLGVRLEF